MDHSIREQLEEPRGVIFILIAPDKKVLLQQRDQRCPRYPGRWCFPGGECDQNEEYLQTVLREAKEEYAADLDASACYLLMRRLGGRNAVYVCPIRSPEGLRRLAGADMRWLSLDEVELVELGFEQADILPVLREFMSRESAFDHSS